MIDETLKIKVLKDITENSSEIKNAFLLKRETICDIAVTDHRLVIFMRLAAEKRL